MVATPSTPTEKLAVRPETLELFITFRGRVWSRQAMDRFIVGRIYGPYDLKESALHLGLANQTFISVTATELEHFWTDAVPALNIFHWWNTKHAEDPDVKRVLEEVGKLMLDAVTFANSGLWSGNPAVNSTWGL